MGEQSQQEGDLVTISFPGKSVAGLIHALDTSRCFLSTPPMGVGRRGAPGRAGTSQNSCPETPALLGDAPLPAPDECPFLRRGRRVGWAHGRKNFQFRNKQRQFLLLLVECQHLCSPAPLSTNRLTNAPSASAKITSMKASITQHSLHTQQALLFLFKSSLVHVILT